MWKEHLKILFGNPPEITNEQIINGSLEIILGYFTDDELDTVQKTKAENLQVSMKYSRNMGKKRNLMTYFYDYATPKPNRKMDERLHPPLSKEKRLRNH